MGTNTSTLNLGRGVGTNIEVGVKGGWGMKINVGCLMQPLQYFVLLLSPVLTLSPLLVKILSLPPLPLSGISVGVLGPHINDGGTGPVLGG